MPCAFSGHQGNNSSEFPIANLGLLCTQCELAIRSELLTKGFRVASNYADAKKIADGQEAYKRLGGADKLLVDDYVKIYVLLSDRVNFHLRIKGLSDCIEFEPDHGLSSQLQPYEYACWFPKVDLIPTGVLPEDDFYGMIARGVLWKDVGASPDHGLYTHRLQWHGVLHAITDGFRVAKAHGWNFGGYTLFVEMGANTLCRSNNFWGKIFDASNQGAYRAPESVEVTLGGHYPAIKMKIDHKYKMYLDTFAKIQAKAREMATEKTRKRRAELDEKIERMGDIHDPEKFSRLDKKYNEKGRELTIEFNQESNSWLGALWESYYFGVRGIAVATDSKRTTKAMGREFKTEDDKISKKWANFNYATPGHNIIIPGGQSLPTPGEVAAWKVSSNTVLRG